MAPRVRTGLIAGLVTFSVLAGATAGYAYWSTAATANLGAGAATLTASVSGLSATTVGNESIASAGSSTLVATGAVTFANTTNTTSTQSPTLQATFGSSGGDASLAAAAQLTVWSVASASSCTAAAVPASPTTGTWGAGVTVSRTLAPGASAVYCVRTTIPDRQSAAGSSGARSFTTQAQAALSIQNFSGSSAQTASFGTRYLFPLQTISSGVWSYVVRAGTGTCLDVNNAATTSGTAAIGWPCKNNSDLNQDFRYTDADADGYGEIQPRNSTGLRLAAPATLTAGSGLAFVTADGSAGQQWQPQLVAGGTYQFVNRYSGLCLSLSTTDGQTATEVACSGGADQKFTLTQRAVIQLSGLSCSNAGSGTDRTVQYSWTPDSGGPYTFNARRTSTSAWTPLITGVTGSSATVPAPIGSPLTDWGTGTYEVQILDSTGNQVGSTSVRVQTSGFLWWAYSYATCS
ncbi:MAG: RICIN domain-containing protein [Actinomycetales bacterium]|nr:RICIN domain-containing protein [Actinomycetales bacterium]